MLDVKKCQKRIFANKVRNNFPTNDVKHEFELLQKEVIEAMEATNNKDLGLELADIAIFVMAIAKMKHIDLTKVIDIKITYNETRTYKAGTYRLK